MKSSCLSRCLNILNLSFQNFIVGLDWVSGLTQLRFTCSKSTIETLEKGVKHVQS